MIEVFRVMAIVPWGLVVWITNWKVGLIGVGVQVAGLVGIIILRVG